ncbi:MAG: ATP-binding protein [Bacteroidota bacterium]
MKIHSTLIIFISLLITVQNQLAAQNGSWEDALNKKSATLDLHWFVSKPFIYEDNSGEITGLEVEIFQEFKEYVKSTHQIDIELNWIESKSFSSILTDIETSNKPNCFGVSAFSVTEERKQKVNFTDAYLSDVAVLVSSEGTPIVRTLDEINNLMKEMTAITIEGTTYEKFLNNLKQQLNLNFEIKYIKSDKNILEAISKAENQFGFIDLPIYLMLIKDGGNLTRQNFFTVKGNGYAFIMPKSSDWNEVFNNFLGDPKTKAKLADITAKYMGQELYKFMDGIYGEENLRASILTKEKELQLEQLKNANFQLEREKNSQIAWIIITIITTSLLTIIFILFYRQQKTSTKLSRQNKQIESQQLSIQNKNEQLSNRNLQLTALNEEKNNLVKILAHDMRSPINHISGLLDILKLTHQDFEEEDKKIIRQTQDAAKRLNQMISKILDFDALEGNRMKVIPETIEVEELFNEVKNELKRMADKKNIVLKSEVDKDLKLTSDHLLLTQILENLLGNAIKFSNPGKTVLLKSFEKNDEIIFAVKDEGPGLTEQDKSLVFKKFQKLSAQPTNGETSTGLGLSIVKKYAELLGGKVWVESEEGEGSAFFIALPKNI